MTFHFAHFSLQEQHAYILCCQHCQHIFLLASFWKKATYTAAGYIIVSEVDYNKTTAYTIGSENVWLDMQQEMLKNDRLPVYIVHIFFLSNQYTFSIYDTSKCFQ